MISKNCSLIVVKNRNFKCLKFDFKGCATPNDLLSCPSTYEFSANSFCHEIKCLEPILETTTLRYNIFFLQFSSVLLLSTN